MTDRSALCFGVTLVFFLPTAGGLAAEPPRPSPVEAPKPLFPPAEGEIAAGVFEQFAGLAEADRRPEKLQELVARNLDRIESPYLRRALLNEQGRAFAQARRWKDAADAYRRAAEVAGPPDGPSREALDGLLSTLRQGASEPAGYEAGVRLARAELAADRVSPARQIEISTETAGLLIFLDRPNDASDAVQAFAEAANGDDPAWRKVRRKAFFAEERVAGWLGNDFKIESYELRLRTEQDYPDLADTPNFLNNLAFAATFAGLTDEAIRQRMRLVERFPDDDRTPGQLVILADDLYRNGESERAAECYRRAVDHPRTKDDLRDRARKSLETARTTRMTVTREPGRTTFATRPIADE